MSFLATAILVLILISGSAITPIAVDVVIGDSITPKTVFYGVSKS